MLDGYTDEDYGEDCHCELEVRLTALKLCLAFPQFAQVERELWEEALRAAIYGRRYVDRTQRDQHLVGEDCHGE